MIGFIRNNVANILYLAGSICFLVGTLYNMLKKG